MNLINAVAGEILKRRINKIDRFIKYPVACQQYWLKELVTTAKNTEFGKRHHFSEINDLKSFQSNIPVSDYNGLLPYIERMMKGEQNILWPSKISWFAKSSGTTSTRSKFIPVSKEALQKCHYKGGKDIITLYLNYNPSSRLFSGKGLIIGGSQEVNQLDNNSKSRYGDVSAVLMSNISPFAEFIRTPSLKIALMDDWEKKLELMAKKTANQNVTNISGVPTWTIILLKKILELKGKNYIHEVWPNLELFIHGAVSFTPYRELFHKLIPSEKMNYLETYNASEGFFGIQDHPDSDGMLLMLDHGVFYEFIPQEQIYKEDPKAIGLEDVEIGTNYAIVITTNAGLWRYTIGDTIKFTSLSPYRFKISGRTKHFINAFGEEVIVENAEKAIAKASKATGAIIDNFTAAPRYFGADNTAGCHEWIVEFIKEPESLNEFTDLLDQHLREINSDYDAKRQKDIALKKPIVHVAHQNTFYDWLKKRGKLGGQNKIPRLANDREYIDDILEMMNSKNVEL